MGPVLTRVGVLYDKSTCKQTRPGVRRDAGALVRVESRELGQDGVHWHCVRVTYRVRYCNSHKSSPAPTALGLSDNGGSVGPSSPQSEQRLGQVTGARTRALRSHARPRLRPTLRDRRLHESAWPFALGTMMPAMDLWSPRPSFPPPLPPSAGGGKGAGRRILTTVDKGGWAVLQTTSKGSAADRAQRSSYGVFDARTARHPRAAHASLHEKDNAEHDGRQGEHPAGKLRKRLREGL